MCQEVTLRPAVVHDGQWLADPEWYTVTGRALYPLRDADAVFMRTAPPVDAAYLLRLFSRPILTTGSKASRITREVINASPYGALLADFVAATMVRHDRSRGATTLSFLRDGTTSGRSRGAATGSCTCRGRGWPARRWLEVAGRRA
jgi:hypothetical protein